MTKATGLFKLPQSCEKSANFDRLFPIFKFALRSADAPRKNSLNSTGTGCALKTKNTKYDLRFLSTKSVHLSFLKVEAHRSLFFLEVAAVLDNSEEEKRRHRSPQASLVLY